MYFEITNMALKLFVLFAMSATLAKGQRPGFAGSKPIGYPELYDKPTTDGLGNRFGEDSTTERLPLEANGDRDLVDRISKLPVDKQPFWFINWQALEANRKKPQTYPQKPNVFIDPIPNTGTQSRTNTTTNRVIPNTNSNSNTEIPNRFSGSSTASSTNTGSNQGANNGGISSSGTENRFGSEPSSNVASTSTETSRGSSGTPNTNSRNKNRFSTTESTNRNVNYSDGNERYSGHKHFRPRTPIIDN